MRRLGKTRAAVPSSRYVLGGARLACLLAVLGVAGFAAAEPALIYPWEPPPPGAIVPCVPCILSVPGLDLLFGGAAPPVPVQAPDEGGAPTSGPAPQGPVDPGGQGAHTSSAAYIRWGRSGFDGDAEAGGRVPRCPWAS